MVNGGRVSVFACVALSASVLFVAGCADEYSTDDAPFELSLGNVSHKVTLGVHDQRFYFWLGKTDSDSLLNEINRGWVPMMYREEYFTDTACTKRKAALVGARCVFTYDFGTYVNYDGVSGLVYNVAYLFSVPRKMLTSILCMNGLFEYVIGLIKLFAGAVAAVIGLVAAPIVNTICHPFETLANLTIGFGDIAYVNSTNIVASLWDLIVGGILQPLWQALLFWT